MMSQLPDEAVAASAAEGHPGAFEELLRRYRKRVYRICYRMAGNAEDAEDWAQECFIQIYRRLTYYDSKLPLLPWMLCVVSNVCINLAKARQLRRSRFDLGLDSERETTSASDGPMEQALRADEAREILEAVAGLTPGLRQAVVLRVIEGLSFHELASALGVPLQTAASRVRRALTQIRERLARFESEVRR